MLSGMFRWLTDVARGDWIAPRLGPFGSAVGSIVPRGYAAYARVLHRVRSGGAESARWSDVAMTAGTVLHPTAQWWALAGRPGPHAGSPAVGHDDPWPDGYDPAVHVGLRRAAAGEWAGGDPDEGSLDPSQLAALVAVLRGFTDPDAVTAAFWTGSSWEGGIALTLWVPGRRTPVAAWRERRLRRVAATPTGADIDPAVLHGPLLVLPNREHLLLAGSLADVAALATATATADVHPFRPGSRTPSLLWPDDRAWCVATDVDLDSTLVGGPRALVDAVLADETLEAFEVDVDDSLGAFADEVNG